MYDDILDKRICDVEEGTENTQTYREYIRECEEEFGLEHERLEEFEGHELEQYIEFLDYLWTK